MSKTSRRNLRPKHKSNSAITVDLHLSKVCISGKRYRILPNGKLFICFAGNMSEIALAVQNGLLLDNLRPYHNVNWLPYAWNVIDDINVYGSLYKAQEVINKFIDKADYVLFLINGEMGVDTLKEWHHCTDIFTGRQIYLGLFKDKDNIAQREKYDPNHQGIFFTFEDANDVLVYIYRHIQPRLIEAKLEEQLSLIIDKPKLSTYASYLDSEISEMKRLKMPAEVILPFVKMANKIETQARSILIQNRAIIKKPQPKAELLLTDSMCIKPKILYSKGYYLSKISLRANNPLMLRPTQIRALKDEQDSIYTCSAFR